MMVGTPVKTGNTSTFTSTYDASCAASGDPGPARHFSWTAPSTGDFVVDSFGSSFDTTITVLDATCSGSELGCSDDAGGAAPQSSVRLTATSGHAYVIVLAGYSSSDTGDYVLNITQPPATETGMCTDSVDNDRDGDTDCADSDCEADPACGAPDAGTTDGGGTLPSCLGITCIIGRTCTPCAGGGSMCVPTGTTC